MNLTLGCTTRPFGTDSCPSIFRRIAAAGYRDVAVFANIGVDSQSTSEHTDAVRTSAAKAGIRPSMLLAHAELEADDPEARYHRLIDQAVALGATWLLDLGTGKPELLDRYIEVMRDASAYAAEHDIRISAKPHGGITLTTEDLISLHAAVNHPAYGICYDPGNIIYYTVGEERPETNVARVAPITSTAIIKDCVIRDGKPDVMITPGEGLVDFRKVLGGLTSGGFRGPLYLECVGGSTPEQIDSNVRSTRDMIEGLLEEL